MQSEISMSVVTEHWRPAQFQSRRRIRWPWRRRDSNYTPDYNRLEGRDDADSDEEKRPLAFLRKWFNVEPVIFLSSISFGLFMNVYPSFLFWARCVEMFTGFDRNDNSTNATEFCSRIATLRDRKDLDLVEADVTNAQIYLQLCSSLPALLTAPLFGAWSDYHGRRPPFILCQFGSFFYLSLTCVASFLYPASNVYSFLVPAELSFGIFSGIMVFTMATTIVVDESRSKLAESRSGIPTRLAAACAIQFVGLFLGASLATLLLSTSGDGPEQHANSYSRAFLLSTGISTLGLLYSQCFVRETHFPAETGDSQLSFRTHLRHYTMDAVGVLLKKREGWSRLCLCLTVSFMFIEFMAMDNSLYFMVLKQFNWSDSEFSLLVQLRVLLSAIGTILLPLLLRCLVPNWPGGESLLVMASIGAYGANYLLMAFAQTKTEFYLLSLFCLLSAGVSPGFRTILARLVTKAETGRLFALVTLVFILCPLASKGILNNFYEATLQIWPGMVFLLIAAFHVVTLLGQMLIHFLMLPQWRTLPPTPYANHDSEDGTTSSGDSDRSVVGSTTAEEEE